MPEVFYRTPASSRGRPADEARLDAAAARVSTVAFEGVEARPVDVQVHVASGNVVFNIVGLGDKASPNRASA